MKIHVPRIGCWHLMNKQIPQKSSGFLIGIPKLLWFYWNSASLHCAELSAVAKDITGYIFPQFSVKDGSWQAERGLSFLISYYYSVSHVLINMLVGQFLVSWSFSKIFNVAINFSWGAHFLRGISGVVPFNKWLIASWIWNECCYKLIKRTKWHLFHSNLSKLSFC